MLSYKGSSAWNNKAIFPVACKDIICVDNSSRMTQVRNQSFKIDDAKNTTLIFDL